MRYFFQKNPHAEEPLSLAIFAILVCVLAHTETSIWRWNSSDAAVPENWTDDDVLLGRREP